MAGTRGRKIVTQSDGYGAAAQAAQVRSGPGANFDFVRLNITRRIVARDRMARWLRPSLLAISAKGLPTSASCRRIASSFGVQGIGRCFISSPSARSRPGGGSCLVLVIDSHFAKLFWSLEQAPLAAGRLSMPAAADAVNKWSVGDQKPTARTTA